METELKLLVRPEDADALRRHPLLDRYALDKPREQTLSGIYFDTENHDLHRADAGLRVRQVNQDWVQTLKAGGTAVAGLHMRNEWESKVNGPSPDLDALYRQVDRKSDLAKLLKQVHKRGRLMPAFTTSVRRTVWDLRLPAGDRIECVIDQGSIEANDSRAQVSEIELELKSGDPKHLFDLALELQNDVPLQLGDFSKADRGYKLLAPTPFAPAKAVPVRLCPNMSVELAFKTIVLNCMEQIRSNCPGLVTRHAVESLHQMRVGLRRLRSALKLFRSRIVCPPEIEAEWRWLGLTLGIARDWDVLSASTIPCLQRSMTGADILDALQDAVRDQVRTSHEAVAAAVDSPRYTRLMLTFCRWVEAAEWREHLSAADGRRLSKPVAGFARMVMARGRRRLLKRGRHLQQADARARHRLRIAAKQARYAAGFFASLYSQKSLRRYGKLLTTLQDDLGRLNDVAVARNLMPQIEAAQPGLRVEVAYLLGYMACRLDQGDPALFRRWEQFKAISPPRLSRR